MSDGMTLRMRINLIRPICSHCKSRRRLYYSDGGDVCYMCWGTGREFYLVPKRWINKWWKVVW